MIEPLIPPDEASRLASLHALGLLDTPAEERFDRITRMALRLFDLPIATVTLLDANRQWFKSCQGLAITETARGISFCAHAILNDDMLVIPDALLDPRFADNPLVTGEPYIRFYAGQPLWSANGYKIGTLCIIDTRPRAFSPQELSALRDLAHWVEHELQTVQLHEAVDLLSESELRYRSLIAALDEGIIMQDASGKIQTVNASAERILGSAADRLIGRVPKEMYAQVICENGKPFPKEMHPSMVALRTGKPCNNVIMGIHKFDGSLTWISVNAQPMFQAGASEPHAVVNTFADITERKQAEVALREAETRFRTLVEQLPVITYIAALDEESSTIYTSPQIETMLGFTQTEWMADHQLWSKQIYPDDMPAVLADIERSHATGTPVPSEYRMMTRTGEVKWFRDQSVIVRDDAGQPLFLQGIMFDITEPKQAEAALRRSESHNQALINAIPDVMFHFNKAGVYLDCRANDLSDLVLLPEDMLGKKIADVLPPDLTLLFMNCIDRALATNIAQVIEFVHVLHNSAREFEARIVICGEDEVLAIVRNITERKQMERMKNEFVSTVSHELRTPLTSIRGSLGLIAGGVAGAIPPTVQRMVDIACKNSDRLIRLINDILDIEKIESGKMVFNLQPIELLAVVEQAVEANRAYAAQFNVTFALEGSARAGWVNADSDRLIQALTNLLANAAKFSPSGDTVQVRVNRAADMIRVAISDHGPGISEAFRAQLFQKFAQADASNTRAQGGTGLGLNITKAIIEKLGGRVEYMPNPHGGATFWLDLPVWHAPTSDGGGALEKPRVLICEDDRDVALLLSRILTEGGFATDIADTTVRAKQLLAEHEYIALTLDLVLPDQNGLALIAELRAQAATRNLPIVVVSAWSDAGSHKLDAAALGFVDWLEKPIDRQRLISAVKQAGSARSRNSKPRILHIEDDLDLHQVIAAILSDVADTVQVSSLAEARHTLTHELFDLILLDLVLPDGSGLEILHDISAAALASPPVVIFSVRELSPELLPTVAAALIKSRTSNAQLVETITALITHADPVAGGEHSYRNDTGAHV